MPALLGFVACRWKSLRSVIDLSSVYLVSSDLPDAELNLSKGLWKIAPALCAGTSFLPSLPGELLLVPQYPG